MGLAVETINIALEKRYVGFSITKEVDGSNSGTINVSIGYYDTENGNNWLSVKESYIKLSSDNLAMLFSMKAGQLGLTDPMLIQSIDTVIYGIISGQIKLTAALTVNVKDADGNPLTATVVLKRQGVLLSQQYVTGTGVFNVDTVLGASVDVSLSGYEPFTKSYSILNGVKKLDVVLKALPVPEPA